MDDCLIISCDLIKDFGQRDDGTSKLTINCSDDIFIAGGISAKWTNRCN
jgi:hypothetical protein